MARFLSNESELLTDGLNPMEPLVQNRFYYIYQVQGADIDQFGHVNNARYIQICEQAAWEHSRHFGVEFASLESEDLAIVVREAQYRYRAPSFLGEVLLVETYITEVSGARMQRHFAIRKEHDELLVLEGQWMLASVKQSSGVACRLPTSLRERYLAAQLECE